MSKNCPIMERMKKNYENRSKTYLTRKIPVIIRLDGKAFHTYTKSLNKPFDEGLISDMQQTAIHLCQNIQGAKCAYTQSDEISILITDYNKLTSEGWFNYNVQKMTSISASIAASRFNNLRFLRDLREEWIEKDIVENGDVNSTKEFFEMLEYSYDGMELLANFDSRVFSIPKEEVNNYFIARQRDAVKNSISMLAQSLYSHKELYGKNGNQMQELCFQKGHNWNDLHFSKKRGSFIMKNVHVNGKIISDPVMNAQSIDRHRAYAVNAMGLKDPVIRTVWQTVDTPEFSKNDIINKLC